MVYKNTHTKLLGRMTIGKGPHRQRIPFVFLGKASASDESDTDSLEADDLESEVIYMDDEVGLYVIEAVSKTISCKTYKGEVNFVG